MLISQVYFAAPVVKSLSIILVRAVDGKTFVNALNDVIARQIKNPNAEEESSLSTLQNTFLGRNLKQGTSIYLTWLEPKRMLVSHCQYCESYESSMLFHPSKLNIDFINYLEITNLSHNEYASIVQELAMLLLGHDTPRLLTFFCTDTSVRSLANVLHFVVMRLMPSPLT